MKSLATTTCLCLALLLSPARAAQVVVDWQSIGGTNVFERQALMFDPVKVDSFVSFQSDGGFRNLVGTEYSAVQALVYLRIGNEWQLFAENNNVRGPYLSEFPLDDFVFLPVDFSQGAIGGINITNSGAGATQYFGMADKGVGTQFVFEVTPVPESSPFVLMALALALLLWFGKKSLLRHCFDF